MTQRPSGWYDDPEHPDQLRYWDGILWTGRTMPKVKPGLDDSHIGDRQTEQPRTHQHSHQRQTQDQGQGWVPSRAYEPLPVLRTPDGERVSGWLRRVIAFIIDNIVVMALAVVVTLPWLGSYFSDFRQWYDAVAAAANAGKATPPMPQSLLAIPWQTAAANVLIYAVYEIGLTVSTGMTVGKWVMGIRVRQGNSPKPPTVNQMGIRFLIKQCANILIFIPVIASAAVMFFLVDSIFPLFNNTRQAIHDRVATTYVVIGRHERKRRPAGKP